MHVEDLLELVAVVGKDVGSVRILGALMQVVVLLHKALQLTLHVGNLASRELVLIEGYLRVGVWCASRDLGKTIETLLCVCQLLAQRLEVLWACKTA